LGERGRIVIRASGTENLVRVMAEGENSTVVRTVVDDLCELLAGNQPANSLAA
jgi:phosphoglucosamine mutase